MKISNQFMAQAYSLSYISRFQYVEFEPFKEGLYNGTIVDDIHIAYRFADILYLVLIHKIQNKVTPRIKLFNA